LRNGLTTDIIEYERLPESVHKGKHSATVRD